ncbi:MAG TPA: RluA family pseudouridine synthase [Saprospiraceae bacterium]|nr:RluA family pseudouridine synthase [Saprospiraceae bacterium]
MNPTGLKDGIIQSNHHFIVYNKPAGMAVQSVHHKEESLESKLAHYCKTKLFLIHRIDQPCSGLVLFTKKKTGAGLINEQLKNQEVERIYLAVVQTKPEPEAGTLHHFLFAHKKSNKSFVVDEGHKEGKAAQLHYQWLGTSGGNHLLMIRLKSGRHHQIRAQLAAIGSPIKGDVKYGAKKYNEDGRIHLHAWKLKFSHPANGSPVSFEAPIPEEATWQSLTAFVPS